MRVLGLRVLGFLGLGFFGFGGLGFRISLVFRDSTGVYVAYTGIMEEQRNNHVTLGSI